MTKNTLPLLFKENYMKALLCGCIAVVLLLSVSTPALCNEQNTYVAVMGGVGLLQEGSVTDPALTSAAPGSEFEWIYDTGYFLGFAVGHDFKYGRGELEIGYQSNTIDDVSVDGDSSSASISGSPEVRLVTLMLNIYYDFKNKSNFTPYLTAGLGLGNMDVDGAGSGGDAVSAYQLGAGIAYHINARVEFDVKYRYLATTDGEFGTTKMAYATNNFILGIRYYF